MRLHLHRGERLQQSITGLVPVTVVVELEVVEVEGDCGKCMFAPFQMRQPIAEQCRKAAAIEAAGEMIDVGEPSCLFFGFPACLEFGRKRFVALPSQKDEEI